MMDKKGVTTIFLIRHGESEINREKPRRLGGMKSNSPLSELGVEQAELTSRYMRDFAIQAFYSSPLDRAYVTAEIIARPHGKPVGKVQGFIENDCGRWEGKTYEEIMLNEREYYDKWMAHPETVPLPEGEDYRQVQERALAALDEVVARHPGESVVIVSHNTVLKVLISHALGLDLSNSRNVKTGNLGITILESKNEKLSVRTLNSIFHLKKY
jgi:broad specificity phosphatase PhoE